MSALACTDQEQKKIKSLIFLLLVFAPLLLIHAFIGPILQDQAYYQFADTRRFLGIPNFWNVASNLPFAIFGIMGVRLYVRSSMKLSWLVFFTGAALVGPGSAFFHWNPHDLSLVFDRLPMTIAFAGILSALVTDVFDLKREKLLLAMTLGVGAYSVIHWQIFSDLRLYTWVQFTPMLALVYVALVFDSAELKTKYLLYAFSWYLLAKAAEYYDRQIYFMLGEEMGGHALKHVFASFGILSFFIMKKTLSARD